MSRENRRPVIAGKGETSITIWVPRMDYIEKLQLALKARFPTDPRYRPDLPYNSSENEGYRYFIRERAEIEQDLKLAMMYADKEDGLSAHPFSNRVHKDEIQKQNRDLGQKANKPRPETRKTAEQYAKLAWDWAKSINEHKEGTPGWMEARSKAYQFKHLCEKRAHEDGIKCPALPCLPTLKGAK